MTISQPLFEINHKAIQVLCREIGAVNTIRFIRQFSQGFGDYTKEREKLLEGYTIDSIMEEIKEMRNSRKAR